MHCHGLVKLSDSEYHLKFGVGQNQGNVDTAKHAGTFEIHVRGKMQHRNTRSKSNSAAQQLAQFLSFSHISHGREQTFHSQCYSYNFPFRVSSTYCTQCIRCPGSFKTTPHHFCTLHLGQNRGLLYTPSQEHSYILQYP